MRLLKSFAMLIMGYMGTPLYFNYVRASAITGLPRQAYTMDDPSKVRFHPELVLTGKNHLESQMGDSVDWVHGMVTQKTLEVKSQ